MTLRAMLTRNERPVENALSGDTIRAFLVGVLIGLCILGVLFMRGRKSTELRRMMSPRSASASPSSALIPTISGTV